VARGGNYPVLSYLDNHGNLFELAFAGPGIWYRTEVMKRAGSTPAFPGSALETVTVGSALDQRLYILH
jgi:hypothetical protein